MSTEDRRVAILGRPNVGKSTLFNALTRSRKAVVRDEPGVTRDVQMEVTEWWGTHFEVMDTGGLTEDPGGFSPLIRSQVLSLLETADLLLLIMDGKVGLIPEDRDIMRIAHESGKPFVIVVNKIDRWQERDLRSAEFYELGTQVIPASFEKRENIDLIVEWIKQHLPPLNMDNRKGIRLALVGKPNVGKSSLMNRILGRERTLVSAQAGTTVDSIEDSVERNGQKYILVDTAGLRRASKRHDGVEYLSAVKSESSIAKADVVLLVIDAVTGPTEQDAKILEKALEAHKGVILVANKSDLATEQVAEYRLKLREKVAREFHFFPDLPVEFVSARTSAGMNRLFSCIETVWEKLHFKVSTSRLNDFFFEMIRQAPSPTWMGQNVKLYYLVKTKQVPPSFIAFANYPEGVTPSYKRFLVKRIQEEWGLEGIPIRIFIMRSKSKSKKRVDKNSTFPVSKESLI